MAQGGSPCQPSDRVYHANQRWPGAPRGTATVLAVQQRPDGTLRVRVRTDPNVWSGREMWWAGHYVRRAEG